MPHPDAEDVLRSWIPDDLGRDSEALARQFGWWFGGGWPAATSCTSVRYRDNAASTAGAAADGRAGVRKPLQCLWQWIRRGWRC